MNTKRVAFERPYTFANSLVERFFSYEVLGCDSKILQEVRSKTKWRIIEGIAPDNVWFGEATFVTNKLPIINLFTDSVTTRIPSRELFNLVFQSGMDHMVGHLYPFYLGKSDYGEGVACQFQYFVSQTRHSLVWKIVRLFIRPIYKVHKIILLSQYIMKPEI